MVTLRADGWAGYEAKDKSKEAVVETQPILCNGRTLSLAANAENGSIVVTLKDAKRPGRESPLEWQQTLYASAMEAGLQDFSAQRKTCPARVQNQSCETLRFQVR